MEPRAAMSKLLPGDVIQIGSSSSYRKHVFIYAGDGYIYDQSCAVYGSNPPTGDKRYLMQYYIDSYPYIEIWRMP